MTDVPTNSVGHGVAQGWSDRWPWDPREQNPALQWPQCTRTYDQMLTDSQVVAVQQGVTLPILRARWSLDPTGCRQEVVERLAEELRLPILGQNPKPHSRKGFSFRKHLRLALKSLFYGFYVFEISGEIGADRQWHFVDLEPRLPTTIQEIHTDRSGTLLAVKQYGAGNYMPPLLPAQSLVFYSHDREGGVWQGRSTLRSAYPHWVLKLDEMKGEAIMLDRNGMGIPIGEEAPGMTPEQRNQLLQVVTKLRTGENSGATIPNGANIKLLGVEGTLPDHQAAIQAHNRQISKASLQMLIDQGQTGHGSQALGSTQLDLWLLSLQAIADEIADTFNEHLIARWVDWNWGPDEACPQLVCEPIGADRELTPNDVSVLVSAGVLTADDSLEVYMRDAYQLPDYEPSNDPTPTAPTAPPTSDPGTADPTAPAQQDPAALEARSPRPFAAARSRRAEALPAWKVKQALEEHWAPQIAQARLAAIDPTTIAARYAFRISAGATDDAANAAAAWLASQTWDLTEWQKLMQDAMGDAYVGGTSAALDSLDDAGFDVVAPDFAAGIDLGDWEPGNASASAQLAGTDNGRGLAELLTQQEARVNGIWGEDLNRLGALLAEGAARGDSVETMARSIETMISDPSRARTIANTELARAVSVAQDDSYREHDAAGRQWISESSACELCGENADAGPIAFDDAFPNGEVPVHPNCRCDVLPVDAAEMSGS